jgi:putative aldouronate transport system substrate-binding protein
MKGKYFLEENTKMKKGIFLILAVLLAGIPLFARGASDGAANTVPHYTLHLPLNIPDPPTKDMPAWQRWEKLLGATMDIRWVPSANYTSMLNTSIAANDLAQIFVANYNNTGAFNEGVAAGMFWETGDMIRNSRNIRKYINDYILRNSANDGKNYTIPRLDWVSQAGFSYRKDWLQKLGRKVPATIDEVIDLARAFTTDDPDGNGKNDTFGFILYSRPNDVGPFAFDLGLQLGTGAGYVEENGRLVPIFMTQPWLDTLNLLKRLYNEKVINQDFATIQEPIMWELYNADRAGIYLGNVNTILEGTRMDPLVAAKKAGNPNIQKATDLWDFAPIKSKDGSYRNYGNNGFYGGIVFTKGGLKTEAEFKAAFNLWENLATDEAIDYINFGNIGEHYELVNGKAKIIDTTKWSRDLQSFSAMGITRGLVYTRLQPERDPVISRMYDYMAEGLSRAVLSPVTSLISPTANQRGGELELIIKDADTKFIMGQLDEAGYKAEIEKWRVQGGQMIMDEFTQARIRAGR